MEAMAQHTLDSANTPPCSIQAVDSSPAQGQAPGQLALLMGGARGLGGDWPKLQNKLLGGWEEFERKWQAKLSFLKGVSGGTPSDEILHPHLFGSG